jgi:hypothetical protein
MRAVAAHTCEYQHCLVSSIVLAQAMKVRMSNRSNDRLETRSWCCHGQGIAGDVLGIFPASRRRKMPVDSISDIGHIISYFQI